MTLEAKILADQARANAGHSSSPTGDVKPSGSLSIAGGSAYRARPSHVVNAGQGMLHRQEHTTELHSLIYKDDNGEIDPGMYARYMIRASADLSISLAKTPAVPAEQVHPDGVARIREADVEVVIFSAAAVNISWPSNVVWGRLGYELSGEPAALSELQGPPANPRSAGTADRFVLKYNERTGEWWASATHLGVVSADPSGQLPDTTVPEEPEEPEQDDLEPGEDATEDTPENEYTDPETGEVLAPEPPPSGLGNLVALHDGAVSFTRNGGYTWHLAQPAPYAADDISCVAGEGTIIKTSDMAAYFSTDLSDFRRLKFERTLKTKLLVENGGFETGDLTGWSLLSGTAPLVLDTVQPPQQSGQFYASSDFGGMNFEISQSIDLPQTDNGEVQISARVFTEIAATAELEVRAGSSGGALLGFEEKYLRPAQSESFGNIKERRSSDISTWRISGANAGITHIEYFNGSVYAGDDLSNITEKLELKLKDVNGLVWSKTMAASQPKPSSVSSTAQIKSLLQLYVFSDKSLKNDLTIDLATPSKPGEMISVTIPAGFQVPLNYVRDIHGSSSSWELLFDGEHFRGTSTNYYPTAVATVDPVYSQKITIPGTGNWHTVTLTVPSFAGTPLEIILRGIDQPVYFDDVTAELTRQISGKVRAIARDLDQRRHVIATETKIWAITGGQQQYLGETPFLADFVVAEGDMVAIASGQNVALSSDSGQTFESRTVSANVLELYSVRNVAFASGSRSDVAVGLLADGSIVQIGYDSNVGLTTIPAAGAIAKDTRRLNWLTTTPAGEVKTTEQSRLAGYGAESFSWADRKDMPASQIELERRIFGTDSGRTFGFSAGSKDLFWNDDLTASWKLGRSLTFPVIDIQEIK